MFSSPSLDHLSRIAGEVGLSLDRKDLADFRERMDEMIADYYEPLASMPDNLPAIVEARPPGRRPSPEEDPHHAWYVKTSIKRKGSGKLQGKSVAIKDNICVAGLPMMNGTGTLEGFVPRIDATVVTRVLDAGGEITGKAHCECLCCSGGSHTNSTGATHNPHKRDHTTGGSSSGCAAIVAAREADFAIGGDQGGSVRTPASFCGICGLKPTYGLVPYTGAFPIELTLDHLGPMTANVADNALLLEVLAGYDGLDPRQTKARPEANYTAQLVGGAKGLKIAILAEGFGQSKSEADVDAAVREAAKVLRKIGAEVEEISIPAHASAMSIWVGIMMEGMFETMMRGNAAGTNWRGLYDTDLLEAHSHWRARADELSDILKLEILFGYYMRQTMAGKYYAKAQNLSRGLGAEYDKALHTFDLLLMPTNPIKAPPLPVPHATRSELMTPGTYLMANVAPFNCTGHPALSIPCAMRDKLPVGMSLVGRYFDEATIYRAAYAFESEADWLGL